MVADTVTALADSLRRTGILEPEQRDELPRLAQRFRDSRAFVRELVGRGWLTPFQANRLAQNRGHELLLGSYVLLELIAEGGMGQVYKAKHSRFGRIVALKVIHKDKLTRRGAIERFQREQRIAAQLDHPNIVHAYDAEHVGDTHFLVMEFVDGQNLTSLVTKNGPLPVTEAADCIRQAALGLQHAHERGMVHRDIKPSNLLRSISPGPDRRERVNLKVLDMGLARMTQDEENGTPLTQLGTVLGTPDFIAPEQARNTRAADIRSDIYSLGCTFYFTLTGKVPFPDGTVMEKLLEHQFDEPTPVETSRSDLPPGLGDVLRRMMAKKPEDRYQTPAEVAAVLQPYCKATAVPLAAPVPVNARTPVKRPLPRAVPLTDGPTETLRSDGPVIAPLRGSPVSRWSRGLLLAALVGGVVLLALVVAASVWYAFGAARP